MNDDPIHAFTLLLLAFWSFSLNMIKQNLLLINTATFLCRNARSRECVNSDQPLLGVFPGGSVVKNLVPAGQEDRFDPWVVRPPRDGNGNPPVFLPRNPTD